MTAGAAVLKMAGRRVADWCQHYSHVLAASTSPHRWRRKLSIDLVATLDRYRSRLMILGDAMKHGLRVVDVSVHTCGAQRRVYFSIRLCDLNSISTSNWVTYSVI